jgi:enoyl-CoA hydratase/carnithine racemase
LTGAGDKAFTASNDLKFTTAEGKGTMLVSVFAGLSQRFDLEKLILAVVNGFAIGGGFETMLSCDIILCSDTAIFALPEVKVGFFGAASGVQRLSRYIGRLAAQELTLTGRSMTAEEALSIGGCQRRGARSRPDGGGDGESRRDRKCFAFGRQSHQAGAPREGGSRRLSRQFALQPRRDGRVGPN